MGLFISVSCFVKGVKTIQRRKNSLFEQVFPQAKRRNWTLDHI